MFNPSEILTTAQLESISEFKREAWEAYMETWRERLELLMMLLVTGAITLGAWRDRMVGLLVEAHTFALGLGAQGVTLVEEEDEERLLVIIEEQTAFVDNWRDEMARRDGEADAVKLIFAGLTWRQLVARGQLYGNVSQATMESTFHTAIGLPEMPAYPRDGRTDCMSNCKCRPWRIQKRDGNGNWNCYWRLGNAEHCETCVARRRVWSPLRIRGGEFVGRIAGSDLFAR